MNTYEPPQIEVLEVSVERGFAGSVDVTGGLGDSTNMSGNNGDVRVGW